MRIKLFAGIFVIVVITLLLLQAVQPSHAAGIVGTGTPDSCSEAALDAALAGGGAITFNCGQSKIVIEILKEKVIAQPTTIDGQGLVTISGGNATRVFHVNSGVTFEVHKLTIAYGAANDTSDTARDGIGGGIYNDGGQVMLVDTMITSGRADHSGGGIYNNAGTVSLIRTTIAGNYVSDIGGGILNEKGAMSIANSTISGNFAGKNGGGIYNFAGTITITNTTLAFNNAGFNGSGILNNEEGTVALKNSIVSNVPSTNTRATGNCGGTLIDGNKNLQFPDNSCGSTITVADPQLGTLADNGGFALTHAVKQGSPVIDTADKNVCAADPINNIDERNVTRPVGASCDIGAYEYDPQHPGKGFADDTTTVTGVCATPTPTATATKPGILVTRRPVTRVPTKAAPTATQPLPGQPNLSCTFKYFTADQNPVVINPQTQNYCTTIRWDVDGVTGVYINGQGVPAPSSRQVCVNPGSTTFTLTMNCPQGNQSHPLTLTTTSKP